MPPVKKKSGRWSKEEHEAFVEAMKKHGKDWAKLAKAIPTRTTIQIRTYSHNRSLIQNSTSATPAKKGSSTVKAKQSSPKKSRGRPTQASGKSKEKEEKAKQVKKAGRPKKKTGEDETSVDAKKKAGKEPKKVGRPKKVDNEKEEIETTEAKADGKASPVKKKRGRPKKDANAKGEGKKTPAKSKGKVKEKSAGKKPKPKPSQSTGTKVNSTLPPTNAPFMPPQMMNPPFQNSPTRIPFPNPMMPVAAFQQHQHAMKMQQNAIRQQQMLLAQRMPGAPPLRVEDIILPMHEGNCGRPANQEYIQFLRINCFLFHSLSIDDQLVFARNLCQFLTAVRGREWIGFHPMSGFQKMSEPPVQAVMEEFKMNQLKLAAFANHPFWLLGEYSSQSSNPPPNELKFPIVHRKSNGSWVMVTKAGDVKTDGDLRNILKLEGPKNLLLLPHGVGLKTAAGVGVTVANTKQPAQARKGKSPSGKKRKKKEASSEPNKKSKKQPVQVKSKEKEAPIKSTEAKKRREKREKEASSKPSKKKKSALV